MATRSMHLSCTKHRQRRLTRHTNSKTPIYIDIRRSETILSPKDELECRQIYEKLQQLQPNGVCVNLNTLRRALYPPTSLSNDKNEQISSLKTYHRRADEIPQIQTNNLSKTTKIKKIDCMNIDQIVNQVKKHAAINYSYYTRTK